MRLLELLFFCCTICSIQAQLVDAGAPQMGAVENDPYANYHQRWNPRMQELFQKVKNDGETVSYYVGAEVGSPFETEEFNKGKVYYKEEDLGEFYYRYNIFSREIEVKKTLFEEEKHKALIRDPNVLLIALNSAKKYRYLQFSNEKGENDEGYLIVLFSGKSYTVYKFMEAKFTEAKPAANSMVNPIPSKFTQFTDYYFQHKDEALRAIPSKKKKFLAQFDATKAESFKAFIKQEKIDLSSEQDLIRLMAFVDQQ
ncbi:MAG: hypothetical protein HKP53_00455 [Eudoraea sp.]|nr:hypothetical protein [Eudoraea sp.]